MAIPASAKTQNLRAGELLYLPTGGPHSFKGIEHASLWLSIQALEPNGSEETNTIYARGSLRPIMQATVLVISLALLFVAVVSNAFAGGLVIGAVLMIFGCLHYWLSGRMKKRDDVVKMDQPFYAFKPHGVRPVSQLLGSAR